MLFIYDFYRLSIRDINPQSFCRLKLSSGELQIYNDKFYISAEFGERDMQNTIKIRLEMVANRYKSIDYEVMLYSVSKDGKRVLICNKVINGRSNLPTYNFDFSKW